MLLDIDKPCRGSNVILKLDLAKAYDTISWDFIIKVLKARGFSQHFCCLIYDWLQNSYYSILINGSTHGFIKAGRGVRQGDPLSPTIFILAFDYLSRMLNDLHSKYTYCQYKHKARCVVSHLAYADDVVIFSNGSKQAIRRTLQTLSNFEEMSGMTFNKKKCQILFSKGMSFSQQQWILQLSGFQPSSLPLLYLGFPLSKGRGRRSHFDGVLDKVQNQLQSWTNSFLSNGGKVTLLRSVLTTFPLYILQMVKMKKSTQKLLSNTFNKFLWEGSSNHCHWSNWEKLCKPTHCGGLGFRSFEHMSYLFFCKQWIKFRSQDSLWALFMKSKYCHTHHPMEVTARIGDSVNWKEMLKVRDIADSYVFWKVGDGELNFWLDHWISEGPLGVTNLNQSVNDFWQNGCWDTNKLQVLGSHKLQRQIESLPIHGNTRDQIIIKKPQSKSIAQIIYSDKFRWQPNVWGKKLWNKYISPSMSFFNWRLFLHLLPLDDILKMKGLRVASRCHLCKGEEESISHVFLGCTYTQTVWKEVLNAYGMFGHFKLWTTILDCWKDWKELEFYYIPLTIFWFVWMTRNDYIHQDIPLNVSVTTRNCLLFLKKSDVLLQHKGGRDKKLVLWRTPPTPWLKINVDGCFKPNQQGIGGVCRNSLGKLQWWFACDVISSSALETEMVAAWWALNIALSLQIQFIHMEMDSLIAIKALSKSGFLPWNLLHWKDRIAELCSKTKVIWSHCPREGNQVADWLAKHSSTLESASPKSQVPSSTLALLLQSDLLVCPHLRGVSSSFDGDMPLFLY